MDSSNAVIVQPTMTDNGRGVYIVDDGGCSVGMVIFLIILFLILFGG